MRKIKSLGLILLVLTVLCLPFLSGDFIQNVTIHEDSRNVDCRSPQVAMDASGNSYVTRENYTGDDGHDKEVYWTKMETESANSDWWWMFRHDLRHTGYSTSTVPDTSNVLWKYATGGWITSSPAVADGKVYVGSYDNNIYCLDADT